MLSRSVLLLLIFLLPSFFVFAQKKDEYKQPRILILLDGSSSMVNPWSKDKDRFHTASDIILRLMDSIYAVNSGVEFSLRVYGHEHGVPEHNCYDTKREVMFSKNNYTQMSLRLESLHPMGVSPIAYSLEVAAENDFVDERDYAYSLILITDGGESCGGDICNVVQTLLAKKIEFKPYIVSLVDYAPLKDQYKCLGSYLTVSNNDQLTHAVDTITEAYRKILAIKIVKPALLDTKLIPSPSALKIKVDPVKITTKQDPVEIKEIERKSEPKVNTLPEVVKSQPEIITSNPRTEKIKVIIDKPEPLIEKPKKIVITNNVNKPDTFKAIKHLGYDRIHYSLFWSTVTPDKRKLPRVMLPKIEAPTPVVTAPIKPKTQPIIQPVEPVVEKVEKKVAAYTTTTAPAQETLLEVFFTDGKGKYYTSTPQMQLLDLKTGQEVKHFYRTTDANGNPDPQTVPAGNYTLVIGKSGNFIAKNVTILPNNHNKVTVIVTKGSLSFAYRNKPKRPVSEFGAVVRKNFEPGPTISQKCTSELEYEPGNYHIEINTLPVSRRTVDLDFGVNVRLDIDEPGYVHFTNENSIGKVAFYCPLGDQYAKFYVMEINGTPQAQKLRLQPGIYQVHWKKYPNMPVESEVVQTFIVKSNQTTEVELTDKKP